MDYIPDNLVITYHHNGGVHSAYEIDENGVNNGFYVDWRTTGELWEICNICNGNRQGLSILWDPRKERRVRYFVDGRDVYHRIGMLVKDINKITPAEKVHVALSIGIVL